MLNHILGKLGLPKRTEINTTQTPALRRIAGLEDAVEDLQDRLDALAANALAQAKRIDELVKASAKASPEPVKPARKTVRRAKP